MKITVDTNILIRAAVQDDKKQAQKAIDLLQKAERIIVPLPVLCEFVWVLQRGYKKSISEIANAIDQLIQTNNLITDKVTVRAGLACLNAGGDFADGVIAQQGFEQGAQEFVSFDKKAVNLLKVQGRSTRLLS